MKYLIIIFFHLALTAVGMAQSGGDVDMRFVAPLEISCGEMSSGCWTIEIKKAFDNQNTIALDVMNVRMFFDETNLSNPVFTLAGAIDTDYDFTDLGTSSPSAVDLGMDEERYYQGNISRDGFGQAILDGTTWTVLGELCFDVDDEVRVSEFCASLTWDKSRDDVNQGIDSENNGVTINVFGPGAGDGTTSEIVDHYNWSYITNNTGNEDTSDGCIETDCELGSISGSVTEDTDPTPDGMGDSPLIGVTIELLTEIRQPVLDKDGNPISAMADNVGNYILMDVPLGNYQVRKVNFDRINSLSGSQNVEITYFPNPVSTTLKAEMTAGAVDAEGAYFNIIDVKGTHVKWFAFAPVQVLDVSDLMEGVYTIQVVTKTGEVMSTSQFIKMNK